MSLASPLRAATHVLSVSMAATAFALCLATSACSPSGSGGGGPGLLGNAEGPPGGATGAPTSGSATLSGAINGASVHAQDVFSVVTPNASSGAATTALQVFITDAPGFCTSYAAGQTKPGISALVLAVTVNGSAPPGPGTYNLTDVTSGTAQQAFFLQTDGSCHSTTSLQATSGFITLDATSGGASGSFLLNFTGGSLSGTFRGPPCGASPAGAAGATCTP